MKVIILPIVLMAASFMFFACSSESNDFLYSCQLPTASCIRVPTVSECQSAGGSVVDACQASSSSSSSVASSSSSSSVGLAACVDEPVMIGRQVWQKCNSSAVPAAGTGNSWCYGDGGSNCAKYGRLYDWAAAMALPSDCNSTRCDNLIETPHRGVCPSGWHIPSREDWNALMTSVGGLSTAGTKLKAGSGWDGNGNGTDVHGFSALPGGNYFGSFLSVGLYGSWWSASELNAGYAYRLYMGYDSESANYHSNDKPYGISVRCLHD